MVRPVELPASLTPKQLELFWAKVSKTDTCWVWLAGKDGGGYGVFSVNRKQFKAHRISCVIHGIPIPDGLIICHKCDNPPCVNPNHFFVGTYKDNQKDAATKGRWRGEKNGTHTHPESRVRGERNSHCILTEDQVREIRSRYCQTDITYAALGKEYGVTEAAITNIVNRRTWAHV